MKILVSAAIILLMSTAVASAQSFNCRRSSGDDEFAICSSPDLRALDFRMNRVYARSLAEADRREARQIRADQREFLADRSQCGGNRVCIRSLYLRRLRDLH